MVILRHSGSGWATEGVIIESIEWLHREIANGNPCALVLDVYPSHRADRVIAIAEANDVELLFVPAGGTGRFQPMDRRIFGELKARPRAEFGKRLWREGSETIDDATSVDILEKCWAAIPSENIKKAWNVVSIKTTTLQLS
jgi:hypothetical protein